MIRWDRYIAIIGRITQEPHRWHQDWYYNGCHTAFCVFGHAAIDAIGKCPHFCLDIAQEWLGLDDGSQESGYIADQVRTLAELQQLAITQKFPWEK